MSEPSKAVSVWYFVDVATPLPELRDRLGWTEGECAARESTTATVMLLCDRLQSALDRIATLERTVHNLTINTEP